MKTMTVTYKWVIGLALLAAFLGNKGEAAVIISGDSFTSTGSNQSLSGTTTGLSTNLPGGSWVWGAGWSWAGPQVNATWLGGVQNAAYLGEESTVLSLALGSSGGYTKPSSFTLSADIVLTGTLANSSAGLGFWSTQLTQSNGASSLTNFTGLTFDETGSLKLYSAGTYTGSSVSLGALSENVFYNLSYTVDTATGGISGIVFNGSAVSGFSTTAFTDSATGFVGVSSGTSSRAGFDNLLVETAAVPEPSTYALMALGLGTLLILRRKSLNKSLS